MELHLILMIIMITYTDFQRRKLGKDFMAGLTLWAAGEKRCVKREPHLIIEQNTYQHKY